MTSQIKAHLKSINFVKSMLPVSNIILETAQFDVHDLKNPEVLKDKTLYQPGLNYGLTITNAYDLNRDQYTCQNCLNKNRDMDWKYIILVYRKEPGSDAESNLIALCRTCHDQLPDGKFVLKGKGPKKANLNQATQMNSTRIQLLKKCLTAPIWIFT